MVIALLPPPLPSKLALLLLCGDMYIEESSRNEAELLELLLPLPLPLLILFTGGVFGVVKIGVLADSDADNAIEANGGMFGNMSPLC